MAPTKPLFDFGEDFDAEVEIGEAKLPVKVTRLSRGQMQEFEKGWKKFFTTARGVVERTPIEQETFEAEAVAFTEQVLGDYLRIEPGYLKSRGQDVVDGAGFIEMFHARASVLGDAVWKIYRKNLLLDAVPNSKSPRDSGTGSEESTQTRGGDAPEPTAGNVVSFDSAKDADATDNSEANPSGASIEEPSRTH
jgi:hypothetical protein